jgi:hypothetical protein
VKKGNATFTPLRRNPNRVNLYRDGGVDGLQIFYYKDRNEYVYISQGEFFAMIHEGKVIAVEQALKKYRKRKFDPPIPRPSGVDYPPPAEWNPEVAVHERRRKRS